MGKLLHEKAREEQFRQALEQLETCAETPIVSGEMVDWLHCCEDALAAVRPLLDQQINSVHKAELAQIRREDSEMHQHVDEMQHEDRLICEEFQALESRMPVLKKLAERVEPDEKRAATPLAEFSQNAMQLVLRIRKQEVAVRTWLVEAFTRDRGVVD